MTASEECNLYRVDGDAFLEALTIAAPATLLIADARTRLARTHPSLRSTYAAAATAAAAE